MGTVLLMSLQASNLLPKKEIIPLRQVGQFVFDTGATNLVLNQTYFRHLKGSSRQAGGIAGKHTIVRSTFVDNFQLGNLVFSNIHADIANLGSIENRRNVRIFGLIGMNILEQYEMHIDLRNQRLELYPIDRRGNFIDPEEAQLETTSLDPLYKITQRNGIMFLRGSVGGKRLDFCLDTGAESNVLCSTCRRDILSTVHISRRTSLTGVGGSDIEVLYGVMNNFAIADVNFAPMQTIVTNLTALSETYGYPVGGVLGYDFFEKGVFSINLAKKEMQIRFHSDTKQ